MCTYINTSQTDFQGVVQVYMNPEKLYLENAKEASMEVTLFARRSNAENTNKDSFQLTFIAEPAKITYPTLIMKRFKYCNPQVIL